MNLTLKLSWKIKLVALAAGLLAGLGAWCSIGLGARGASAGAVSSKADEPMPNLQGEAAVDYLKRRGLYQSIKAKVEADRHEIRWTPEAGSGGAYQADNPGQNLRASFSRNGALIAPCKSCGGGAKWQVEMKLRGVGYGDRLSEVATGPMRISGNRIEIPQSTIQNPKSTTRNPQSPNGMSTRRKGSSRVSRWRKGRAFRWESSRYA